MTDQSPNEPVLGDLPGEEAPRISTKRGVSRSPKRAAMVLVVVVVIMVGIVGVTYVRTMGPGKPLEGARTAPVAANVTNIGFGADEQPSPRYRELAEAENAKAIEVAEESGGRAVVPQITGDPLPPEPAITFEELPASPQRPAAAPAAVVDRKQVQAMVAEARRRQAAWAELAPPGSVEGAALSSVSASSVAGVAGSAAIPGPPVPLFVVQSGVIEVGANSDYPAEVIIRLTSGPLAGSRAVGSFRAGGTGGVTDRVQLRVERIEVEGQLFSTDGLAVDPATRIPAIEGDINRHLARNILARGSVAFLLGYAGGISQRGGVGFSADGTVISSFRAGDMFRAEAAREAASAASEVRIRQPTVTLPAGSPVGVVFLAPLSGASAQRTEVGQSSVRQPRATGGVDADHDTAPQPLSPNVLLPDGTELEFSEPTT